MTLSIGDSLPEITLKTLTEDGPADTALGVLVSGKKIALFAVPGAFTPTCTLNHLPGYLDNLDTIKANGVDDVIVVAVNDPFVMGAWAEQSGGKGKIQFVADWDGAFTKAIGMDIDLGVAGLGVRSKRYSMIVEDGKVTTLNVEDNPGEADVSGAAALIEQL